MTEEERLQEVLYLMRLSFKYNLCAIVFIILGFVMLFRTRGWFPLWCLCELGYFISWWLGRKYWKEAKELENGGGRSNRN